MDPGTCRTHPSVPEVDPRGRGAQRGTIQQAVRLIMSERAVHEMAAYGILVQAAADAGVSVHQTACRIMADSE